MTFENIKINFTSGVSGNHTGFANNMSNIIGSITINGGEIYGIQVETG